MMINIQQLGLQPKAQHILLRTISILLAILILVIKPFSLGPFLSVDFSLKFNLLHLNPRKNIMKLEFTWTFDTREYSHFFGISVAIVWMQCVCVCVSLDLVSFGVCVFKNKSSLIVEMQNIPKREIQQLTKTDASTIIIALCAMTNFCYSKGCNHIRSNLQWCVYEHIIHILASKYT